MPTILSCTDGSAYAPSVYDHTIWAAKRMDAKVRVLHMLNPSRQMSSDLSGNVNPGDRDSLLREIVELEETANRVAQKRGRAILQAAEAHFENAGFPNMSTEQRRGTLVESLKDFPADLIVIGKRGESADFAKLHLGANLERVIRSSTRPVFVTSRAFQPIEHGLIAFDGSPSAKKAVQFAIEKPLLKGLKLTLLTAGKPISGIDRELELAKDQLQQMGYGVSVKKSPKNPETALAETISDAQIDLLIMGAYGHSRIRQLIVGSTTTIMVRTCRIPVLMFR